MNAGVISSRYGKALLKFVQETGAGEKVYSQACVLVLRMRELSQLADALQKHPEINADRKLEIVAAALGEPLADEMVRFIRLVHVNRRMEFLGRMMDSFISQYRNVKGIKMGRVVTALPAPGLNEKMKRLVYERTGADLVLEENVDPDIIGGFIFEVDDLRMDASVRTQFRRLRRELIENNNRIV